MRQALDPGGVESHARVRVSQSWSLSWVATGLGVAISFLLFFLVRQVEERRDDAEFRRKTAAYVSALQERRNSSEDLMRTLRALFFQNPNLGRELFANAVLGLAIRLDGVQAIGWAPRVVSDRRSAFEQTVRDQGLPGFQIVEGDLIHQPEEKPSRALDRPEYFPLLFLEPMEGNEVALGYDLASEPSVAELLNRTRDAGESGLSGPVSIPYNTTVRIGVLAAIPVYFPEFVPVSGAARTEQIQGYVVAVSILDELLKAVEARTRDPRLDVLLMDETKPGAESVMSVRVQGQEAARDSPGALARFRDRPHHAERVVVGGRHLLFDFRRSDRWDPGLNYWLPFGVLCIGLLSTGLLAQFLRSSSENARRIEAMVHVRTAELDQANAKLKEEVRDRMEVQKQLARERHLLFTLLNRLPDAVYATDRQGNYVLANEAHAHLIQQTDPASILGRPVREVGPCALAETLASSLDQVLLAGKAVLGQEFTVALPANQSLNLEVSKLPLRDGSGEIDGVLGISRDVTQLKRNEAENRELAEWLQETQKLESLGILAGGIAHDFNNLLTVILGNASLARSALNGHSSANECLNRIEATSMQASDLCRQMLAYSGKGRFVVRRLDLSQLVQQTTELLQLSISKKASLSLRLDSALPPVSADATQLQQILMNLVINASDAIGDRDGVIRISSGIVHVDRAHLRQFTPGTDIPDGEYVFLEVGDNGCGMSSETLRKIFDPFFTTKFVGRGLGLAAVLGIVRGHRGAITVQSKLGEGTTFRLLLPRADGPVDNETPALPLDESWKGAGTLLLADDEEAVRVTTAEMLQRAGFTVDLAENGRSALEKFQVEPSRYRAVLLDLTMPVMDGEEAFREIRRIHPGARVLLMSGFSTQVVEDRFAGKGLSAFIQKPYLPAALYAVLRKMLEDDRETPT